ncbi:hypothetical protein SAMN05216259_1192 [Actinacidiphila guanduensis]|uniref:Uncharacterized protein n=1 Tax=Actinacidiphila guanduensis TaxID=310781 RepID=A0A1H0QK60_9ACTN|nr:hypothetical protein SAMN05216259_1192 [Actinacidiphila guanduensis]
MPSPRSLMLFPGVPPTRTGPGGLFPAVPSRPGPSHPGPSRADSSAPAVPATDPAPSIPKGR